MSRDGLSYDIRLIHSASEFILEDEFTKYLVLTDKNLYAKQSDFIDEIAHSYNAFIYVMEAGEETKNLLTLEKVLEYASDKLDRKSLIINVGGGVVTDIGGFAASILYRGIKHVNVATSLLAMTDAAIGSKTGIDFCHKKNILGTFYDPYKVFALVTALETLPNDEYTSGMAEVIKHALIYDNGLYEMLDGDASIEDILNKSIQTKVHFVCEDKLEADKRMSLNFGHTFGHIIEAMSGYRLSHGRSVAIGMKIALELGRILNITDEATYDRSLTLIQKHYPMEEINYDIETLKSDKKIVADKINFIFLKDRRAIIEKMDERKVVELYNEHIKNKKL